MFKGKEPYEGSIFVSPGEKLGVIEEFIAGNGTYTENGTIYSLTTGQMFLDKVKREIRITSNTSQPLIPKIDDIIIGEITHVQDKNLVLKIIQIEKNVLLSSFTGIMHISDVGTRYVKTLNDVFKVGDTIRARVISTKNGEFHLSTKNEKFGVIQAVCVYCGYPLNYEKNKLKCVNCSKVDNRKLAIDYENL